jgi:hypothetical protein
VASENAKPVAAVTASGLQVTDQAGGPIGPTHKPHRRNPQAALRTGIVGRGDLNWRRGDDNNTFALHLGNSRAPLLSVVPDCACRGMWRVSLWGGLSDFTNLTRALDAGAALALAELNEKHNQETAPDGPPVRFERAAAP